MQARVRCALTEPLFMEHLRPSLTLYAYNILGSYEDAKDIVQDVFLKYSQLDPQKIQDERLFLIKMVVNLSIDRKRKQKKILASYPGHWLPEPTATENPENALYQKEILSYSLMVLLEKLASKPRAVFILKEAFDYDHDEIARTLDITADNSRKILSRARLELSEARASGASGKVQSDLLQRYLKAIQGGDMQQVEALLRSDITVVSDGGGKATAFRNIISGNRAVGALLTGLSRKTYHQVLTETGWINHQPAMFYFHEDKIVTCQIFTVADGQFSSIFFIRNPDKLKELQSKVSRFSTPVRLE
jgi:RNA polymerase sigma factor (sigma-70 family)